LGVGILGLALLGLTLYTSILSYALRTYSRSRLAEYLPEASRRTWIDRLDRHESELQVITSFIRFTCVLALLVCVEVLYVDGRSLESNLTTLVVPPLITLLLVLLFAIGVPNALALHAGEGVLARSLILLWVLRLVLTPVAKGLMAVEFIVRRLLGRSEETPEEESERMEQEILNAVSEGELHGAVDEEQKEIIESVFELHDTTVSEIMTPRTDIVAIPADATFEQAGETIDKAGHSRIPVYEESLDRIIGMLYAKDLIRLNNGAPFDLRKLMRSVPYVPETKTIDHLLRELRQGKVHIAIVLDEYGGTAGLVTIEDILEELVGEIDDEYDRRPPPAIRRIDADTVEVDARAHVHEVNDELGVALPDDGDYETIGGFVFTTLGKIPVNGEELTHENIHIRVIDAEPRRIKRLEIRVEREPESA
jgi:putative hemolysin